MRKDDLQKGQGEASSHPARCKQSSFLPAYLVREGLQGFLLSALASHMQEALTLQSLAGLKMSLNATMFPAALGDSAGISYHAS